MISGGGGNNREIDIVVNFKPGQDASVFDLVKRDALDIDKITKENVNEVVRGIEAQRAARNADFAAKKEQWAEERAANKETQKLIAEMEKEEARARKESLREEMTERDHNLRERMRADQLAAREAARAEKEVIRERVRGETEAARQVAQLRRQYEKGNREFATSLTGMASGAGQMARGGALLFGASSEDLEKFIRLFAGVEGGIQVMTGLTRTVREGERAWKAYASAQAAATALQGAGGVGGAMGGGSGLLGGIGGGGGGSLVIPVAAMAAAALSAAAALKGLQEAATGSGRIADGEASAAQWIMRTLGSNNKGYWGAAGDAAGKGGLSALGGAIGAGVFGLPGMAVGGFTGYKLAGEAGAANSAEDRAARQQGFRDAAHMRSANATAEWSINANGQSQLDSLGRRSAAWGAGAGLSGGRLREAQNSSARDAATEQLATARTSLAGVESSIGGVDTTVQRAAYLDQEKAALEALEQLEMERLAIAKEFNTEDKATAREKLALEKESLTAVKHKLEAEEHQLKSAAEKFATADPYEQQAAVQGLKSLRAGNATIEDAKALNGYAVGDDKKLLEEFFLKEARAAGGGPLLDPLKALIDETRKEEARLTEAVKSSKESIKTMGEQAEKAIKELSTDITEKLTKIFKEQADSIKAAIDNALDQRKVVTGQTKHAP